MQKPNQTYTRKEKQSTPEESFRRPAQNRNFYVQKKDCRANTHAVATYQQMKKLCPTWSENLCREFVMELKLNLSFCKTFWNIFPLSYNSSFFQLVFRLFTFLYNPFTLIKTQQLLKLRKIVRGVVLYCSAAARCRQILSKKSLKFSVEKKTMTTLIHWAHSFLLYVTKTLKLF